MTAAPPPAGDRPVNGQQNSLGGGVTARFLVALGREVDAEVLTPAALARAVVRVLPVDGAGLPTLANVLRLPLGASSDAASQAEELQTSLGEGPCLDTAEAQAAVVVDLADTQTRWPLYAEELAGRTAFRAVAAVPLRLSDGAVFAALPVQHPPLLDDRLDRTPSTYLPRQPGRCSPAASQRSTTSTPLTPDRAGTKPLPLGATTCGS